ncbi:hypothetical protein GOV13_00680 [Candidatus Pacearchaeota archaeon]|nr:hypothetical protein [Candidatus Pacearchaeota archaeon]
MLGDKKGQGLSVNAIIMIVLGVAVLVLLIAGFSMGWGTIFPFLKSNNVDTIAKACSTACTTNSIYDFCSMERDLKDDKGNEIKTSCAVLSSVQEFNKYGVDSCSLGCRLDCTEVKINGVGGSPTPSIVEKDCSDFDGDKSACDAKNDKGDGCIWQEYDSKCLRKYMGSGLEEGAFYDVTDITVLSRVTNFCIIPQ